MMEMALHVCVRGKKSARALFASGSFLQAKK